MLGAIVDSVDSSDSNSAFDTFSFTAHANTNITKIDDLTASTCVVTGLAGTGSGTYTYDSISGDRPKFVGTVGATGSEIFWSIGGWSITYDDGGGPGTGEQTVNDVSFIPPSTIGPATVVFSANN
jgi:hypothetical protein